MQSKRPSSSKFDAALLTFSDAPSLRSRSSTTNLILTPSSHTKQQPCRPVCFSCRSRTRLRCRTPAPLGSNRTATRGNDRRHGLSDLVVHAISSCTGLWLLQGPAALQLCSPTMTVSEACHHLRSLRLSRVEVQMWRIHTLALHPLPDACPFPWVSLSLFMGAARVLFSAVGRCYMQILWLQRHCLQWIGL